MRRCVVLAALATACAGCRDQPNFTIPVCESKDVGCRCQLTGWIICDSVCKNALLDPDNCGGCGNSCGGQVCVAGACVDGCGTLGQCGDACTDDKDPYNCGGCGNVCEGGCVGGVCGRTAAECAAEKLTACDGECADLKSNQRHCGACGNLCTAMRGCGSGACCRASETLCNNLRCVDLQNDPLNCGACNNRCLNPMFPHCSAGECVP